MATLQVVTTSTGAIVSDPQAVHELCESYCFGTLDWEVTEDGELTNFRCNAGSRCLTVTHATITDNEVAETREPHDLYQMFSDNIDADAISERRFRDRLIDLADSGILSKDISGWGRGPDQTNRYELEVKVETALDKLDDDSRLGDVIKNVLRPRIA